MDQSEFLNRLTSRSLSRYGVKVSRRKVSDWIDEELMPGPNRIGRQWIWNPHQYRRALQICRLKNLGCSTHAGVRIQLWLLGYEMPIDLIRESLQRESCRQKRAVFSGVNSTYDPRGNKKRSPKKIDIVTRGLGERDKRLPIALTKEAIFDSYGALRFGHLNGNLIRDFEKLLATFVPSGDGIKTDSLGDDDSSQHFSLGAVCGIFGELDEIENAIDFSGLDEKTLRSAREFLPQLITAAFIGFELKSGADSLRLGDNQNLRSVIKRTFTAPDWKLFFYFLVLNHLNSLGDA